MFTGKKIRVKKIQIKRDNLRSHVITVKRCLRFKINVPRVCWTRDEDVELKREGKLSNLCILAGL